MNIYEARRNSLKKRIYKVFDYLRRGYIVFLNGKRITREDIYMGIKKYGTWQVVISSVMYYNHDSNYDNGYYTTIKELKSKMKFEILDPKNLKTI